jgi:uncharacterized membrane protein
MRHFSVAPSLTTRGRARKGLRGMAGKPFHPPLTDIPIAAYLFAAVFDVLSGALHPSHRDVAEQLYRAGTWTLLGGAAVSVLAALTGWADWHRSSTPGTQARRTANTHALTMVTVTVLTLGNLALRLTVFSDRAATPPGIIVMSAVIAVLVSVGATFGGSLVYDYGFNVETAGDSPVWHASEQDVFPGGHAPVPAPVETPLTTPLTQGH